MSDPIVACGPATAVPAGHAESLPTCTSEEVLELMAAAYERGYAAGLAEASRLDWNSPQTAGAFRRARQQAEAAHMKAWAGLRYERRGYPAGYDYRGGTVDWDTGLPEGSGCAWLRRKQTLTAKVAA